MNSIEEVIALLKKKINGNISDFENILLKQWAKESEDNNELLQRIDNEEEVFEDIMIWLRLREDDEHSLWSNRLEAKTIAKIKDDNKPVVTISKIYSYKIVAIAAFLILVSACIILVYKYKVNGVESLNLNDLRAGTNKATITLSNGQIIPLRSDKTTIIIGKELAYNDGTTITKTKNDSLDYAVIGTPRGGHYQIVLADGSKVWLNADSKLKYPVKFIDEERIVELEGEAYFEIRTIKKNGRKVPFIVKSGDQKVAVLGTSFNMNSYDISKRLVTLVEGKVKISTPTESIELNPGEQVINTSNKLEKAEVDIRPYIAWKDNEFLFEETELNEALLILSRWYDFDVIMNHYNKKIFLYASISRTKNLKGVLNIMEVSGLKFKLEKQGDRNKLIVIN